MTKKLIETKSSIQAIEFDVELLEKNYKELDYSLRHFLSARQCEKEVFHLQLQPELEMIRHVLEIL